VRRCFATHQAGCTAAALNGSLCPRLDLWRDPKATMTPAKKSCQCNPIGLEQRILFVRRNWNLCYCTSVGNETFHDWHQM